MRGESHSRFRAPRRGRSAPTQTAVHGRGAGCFQFEWLHPGSAEVSARGRLCPPADSIFRLFDLHMELEVDGKAHWDHCYRTPSSVHALLKRLRKALPVAEDGLRLCVEPDADIGPVKAGATHPARAPTGVARSPRGATKWRDILVAPPLSSRLRLD